MTITHGKSKSVEFHAWAAMLGRCLNRKNPRFKFYGGRGIRVCARWQKSFEHFYADVGPRPSAKYSLERVRNMEGYKPNNVLWATKKQQMRNTRRTRFITYRGKRMSVSAAVETSDCSISVQTVIGRLDRKWTPALAIETPAGPRRGGRKKRL